MPTHLQSKYEILTPSGWSSFGGIQKLENRSTLKIYFDDNSNIICTPNHRFIVDTIPIYAKELKESDKLQTCDGYRKIIKIEENGLEDVFDILQVGNVDSSFFANGIISHNCSFEGSSKTLINGESLERLAKMLKDGKKESEWFTIWFPPKKGRVYIAGLDVGSGSGSDNSVIAIFDVTNYYSEGVYELVALYKRNDINVFDFAKVIETVAKRYNYAACICENNGTGLGGILLNELYMEQGYENVFYDYDNQTLGVNANSQTKPMATTNFKEDIEGDICKAYSVTLLVELRIYEEKNSQPGKFSAKRGDGNRDDQVSACYWAAYLLRSKWWDDNKNDFYNKVIVQQTNRSEEVQAEEELDNFKRIFSDGGLKTPEQEMEEFEREMQGEN